MSNFIYKIKSILTRFKIFDSWKYILLSYDDKKCIFTLSEKEYESVKKIREEKEIISYEFYSNSQDDCFGIKLHIKDNEIIDITDNEY